MNQKDKLTESLMSLLENNYNFPLVKTFGRWRLVVKPSKWNKNKLEVDFYDTNDIKFGVDGQFTGASYYLDDLVIGDSISKSIKDMPYLSLVTDVPAWTVEKDDLDNIYLWLKEIQESNAEEKVEENSCEKNKEVKKEGLQDQRLQASINSLKELGYEVYKEDDNYVALINKDDKPVLAMFWGKSAKPKFHYRFNNMQELDNYLDKYIQNKLEIQKSDEERRQQRKLTKDHDIKVGDIFYTYWGYDQTNSEFYEVVDVKGSRIYLQEIQSIYDNEDESWGQTKITPDKGNFVDDIKHTASARADGTITNLDGESFLRLSKYTGSPISITATGWGH